jgi:hypothetical protein
LALIKAVGGLKGQAMSLSFRDGRIMGYYRLYIFRSQTGRIREVREFEASHDFAAISQSAKWRAHEAMELWYGARKVSRWSGGDVSDAR